MARARLVPAVWIAGSLLVSLVVMTTRAEEPWQALVASGQLVDVRKYDPTIVVELRYASARNCVGAAVYPAEFPCLTRPDTAVRLRMVQNLLHNWGYRLKIWDAYRPPEAQRILYQKWAGKGFVANPDEGGGSLHTSGLAVDATLVDLLGREVSMPSGFDEFKPEAGAIYEGKDKAVAMHLHLLQGAMGAAGFMGLRNEWWHFAVKDWATQPPLHPPGGPLPTKEKPADAPDLVTAPDQTAPKPSATPATPRSKRSR